MKQFNLNTIIDVLWGWSVDLKETKWKTLSDSNQDLCWGGCRKWSCHTVWPLRELLKFWFIVYTKLLAETMHDVSNDLVPSNLKEVFLPTAKVHSYNTRSSASKNFFIKKSSLEIKRLWNELPTKLRMQPKIKFKNKIRWILFNMSVGLDLMFISSRCSCCGGRSVVVVVGGSWEYKTGLLLLFSSILFSKVTLAHQD